MAYDKVVDSARLEHDLTEIAAAIRRKNGSSAAIDFPAGFKAAISAINGGGLRVGAENLHKVESDIADTYLQDGIETPYNSWSATDFIPLEAGSIYALQMDLGGTAVIQGIYSCLYAADKSFRKKLEGGIASLGSGSFVLFSSESSGYMRFSGHANQVKMLKIFKCSGSLSFEANEEGV